MISDFKRNNVKLNFNINTIKGYFNNPAKHQKELREVSRYLYTVFKPYQRIIHYYATNPTFFYLIEPLRLSSSLEKEKVIDKYLESCYKSEALDIQREFTKASIIAWTEDVYFGYEYSSNDAFFLTQLNPDYCCISSIIDGNFGFSFDFRYFDTYKDQLEIYPEEFQHKYKIYLSDKVKKRWQEINPNKSVCLKVNDHLLYSLPPFLSVFEDVLNVIDLKAIKKAKTESDNFDILHQEVPLDQKETGIDKFKLSWENMVYFHEMAMDTTPDSIGVITSPMKLNLSRPSRDNSNMNIVSQGEDEFYASAGTDKKLFKGGDSSVGFSKSLEVDDRESFRLIKQVENWHNRKLKEIVKGKIRFRARYPFITHNNKDNVFNQMLTAAQNGFPTRKEAAAALGLPPSALYAQSTFDMDFLDLDEKMKPLKSTHTSSNDGSKSQGRQKLDEDKLSDSTVRGKDNDSNEKRLES